MEILSISIDKDELKQLEKIQKRLGFKSRSKMLRSAVTSMLNDYERLDSLKGNVESVFVLTYAESEKNKVSDVLHKFKDAIKIEMHQHRPGVCIDVLNIDASAIKTRELFGVLKKNRCVYSVNYSVVSGSERAGRLSPV
ncbi:Putative nickel-responsive regulator [uncultured archaeon]|nr:Putative nickel-responsive regulator [uncultured archaeon]